MLSVGSKKTKKEKEKKKEGETENKSMTVQVKGDGGLRWRQWQMKGLKSSCQQPKPLGEERDNPIERGDDSQRAKGEGGGGISN